MIEAGLFFPPTLALSSCLAPHIGHEQALQPLNPQLFFLLLVSLPPLPRSCSALSYNNDGQDPLQDTTPVCHPRDERPVLLPANKNERGTERHGGSSRITNKQTLAIPNIHPDLSIPPLPQTRLPHLLRPRPRPWNPKGTLALTSTSATSPMVLVSFRVESHHHRLW